MAKTCRHPAQDRVLVKSQHQGLSIQGGNPNHGHHWTDVEFEWCGACGATRRHYDEKWKHPRRRA